MEESKVVAPDAQTTIRTLIAGRNPKWADADNTVIELEVHFEENAGLGFLPFSCSADDTTYYGIDVFNRAVAGEFGEIATYIAPLPAPYTLWVSDMWDRMTDDEGEDFDAAVSVAPPLKSRKAFQSAQTLQSDSDLFAWVKNVLRGVTTAARADAIMA
jgi:hypothetical protein